ncbi:MAG: hypothetical protein JXA04_07180 [Gammaproteobacteria bacterium]|nr:hypothetical protein [Gammaproteobacteria bacterium]
MNVLFASQSASLPVFSALRSALASRINIERAGFLLADSWAYQEWLEQHPGFEGEGYLLLKEWEITNKRSGRINLPKLANYEKIIGGDAGLFGALVADRRLFMGRNCTFHQDYRRRFTDEELLLILQNGLEEVENIFDKLKPDALVGFICVTMIDYLAYLFARSRGIPIYNLRPTRVGDKVIFGSTLNDPDPKFVRNLEEMKASNLEGNLDSARQYIKRVREKDGRYEGVINASNKTALKLNPKQHSILGSPFRVMYNYIKYKSSVALNDNHVPDPLRALFFNAIINPIQAKLADNFLKKKYVLPEKLGNRKYAFFPFHTEPEVSLLVYGRPFVNQIEIIRSIAMSLPVDMILVVKEHPWMVGKRSLKMYKKLLNIPRVYIVSPSLSARDLILGSDLVAVITGSVALEAAILGKPVLTFGDCPFNALPKTMIRRCRDIRHLPRFIRDLLYEHKNDERSLEMYIAAVMKLGCSVNLYSTLLNKNNVYSERNSGFSKEIGVLADYLVKCMRSPTSVIVQGSKAAAW